MNRLNDLIRFYQIMGDLEQHAGGMRRLADCHGRMAWPARGVYFFFEHGENRLDTGEGLRVVRVGTHALKAGSRTSLWNRLSQHRGVFSTGGGNHRGSIFRLIVGEALIAKEGMDTPTWGIGSDPGKAANKHGLTREDVKMREQPVEVAVGHIIRDMPFLWLDVADDSGPDSQRGYIERNAIALLSNNEKVALDIASPGWLGSYSSRNRVRQSGLWNSNHVDEIYDPEFLSVLEYYGKQTAAVI